MLIEKLRWKGRDNERKISIKNIRSRIGIPQVVVFLSFLTFSFLTARLLAPIVKSDAATNNATAGNSIYSVSISANDSVSIPITPTSEQQVFSGTNQISYTNTCPSGFNIYIGTKDDTTSLKREGSDSLTKEIPTISAGTALADNTWGYTTGSGTSGNTSYYPIPSKSAPAVLFNATTANTTAKTLDVTYAIKVNDSIPSGTYSNNVQYSLAVDSACLTYKVNWDFADGTGKTNANYSSYLIFGNIINLSVLSPTRTNYTFLGWNSSDGKTFNGTEANANISPSDLTSITMTAQWKYNLIRYDVNDGEELTKLDDEKPSSSLMLKAPNYKRDGYGFAGWNTNANGSGTNYGPNETIDASDMVGETLYAQWIKSTGDIQRWEGCNTMANDAVIALTDTRDNNTYTILKGKDGKCWMIENLRLINTSITSSDSNISASSFKIPVQTWRGSGTYTSTELYDTNYTTYGVYYNYFAATAGTISGNSNSTTASYDICTNGWRLPARTEADDLLNAYSIGSNAASLAIARSYPLNFVHSGYIAYDAASPASQGTGGYWWTSTADNTMSRYSIYVNNDNAHVTGNGFRLHGFSVRCVAS